MALQEGILRTKILAKTTTYRRRRLGREANYSQRVALRAC